MIKKVVGFLVGPALVILGMVLSFVVFKMSRHMLGVIRPSNLFIAYQSKMYVLKSEV
jgi:hypothetical protein